MSTEPNMDLKEINDLVKVMDGIVNDVENPGEAHFLEDYLYHKFVRHIANTGNAEQVEMAKAILKTEEMDFER